MPARIERENGVALSRDAVALDERVHLLPVAREPVEEDDGRPAAGRCSAIGKVERRCDRNAVVHRDRDVLLRSRGAGGFAGDEDESRRKRR